MNSAIVISGWTLRVDGAEPRVRDLDLGERAGLARPRDVRRAIKAALEDGALALADHRAELRDGSEAKDAPRVWEEREAIAIGSGAERAADVYYLNEAAALVVLTRLRTKSAVQVTQAIVRVFIMARKGELSTQKAPAVAPALPDPTPGLEAALRVLPGLVPLMGDAWAKTKAEHVMARLTGEEPQAVAPRLLTVSDYLAARGLKAAEMRKCAPALGKVIKAAYLRRHGAEPPKVDRFVDGAVRPVAAYSDSDRDLFDEAFALTQAPKLGRGAP